MSALPGSWACSASLAVTIGAAMACGAMVASAESSHAEQGTDTAAVDDVPCRAPHDSYFVAAFDASDPTPPYRLRDPQVLLVTDTLQTKHGPLLQLRVAGGPELGAVNGLAHDARRHTLYAASHLRYFAAYGPGGPGTIYAIDLLTSDVREWASLDAGPDRWTSPPSHDDGARYAGRTDLGDIEINEAGSKLFVANLFDRRIHVLSVPDGNRVGVFDHGAAGEAWAANARIFGLGVRADWLYHAVVDSRESPQLPGDFAAHVYRSRDDGAEMELVLQLDLGYRRDFRWQPWRTKWDDGQKMPLEPLLSDIEFRPNGDLILGLRNRDASVGVFYRGDVLPTIRSGRQWYPVVHPEHYQDALYWPRSYSETMQGGLAVPPLADRVVVTASAMHDADPLSSGIVWFDNDTGYPKGPADGQELLAYGENLGLGDIEYNCVLENPMPTPTQPTPKPSPTASPMPSGTPSPTAKATARATVNPSPAPARHDVYLPWARSDSS